MARQIRTFVAIEVSAPIRRRLAEVQRRLQTAARNVKWVQEQNIHLTLKFLGDVEERKLYEVCKAVERAAAGHEPFQMAVVGLGAFPHPRRPRVIWAGVGSGAEQIVLVAASLDSALEPLGYRRESRAFTPHITLGRFRRPGKDLEAELAGLADWQAGCQTVEELQVMSSELRRDGPLYTILSRASLGE